MDKASISIATLVNRYLSACRLAGISPKPIRDYNEKLKKYMRIVGGTLGDFALKVVRHQREVEFYSDSLS